MHTAKNTPGPWELCERGEYSDFDGNSRVILGDDVPIRIAAVHTDGSDECEANARLITAAPELLYALEELLFCAVHGNGLEAHHKAQDKARTAIAKARGEG